MPSGNPKADRQSGLRAKAPLAARFEDCLQASIQLTDALQANQPDSHQLRDLAQDCRDKLGVWGDDSGASSRVLDYALKCSPTLVRQIQSLLTELHSTLQEAGALVRPQLLETDNPDAFANEGPAAIPNDQDVDPGPEASMREALDVVACLVKLLPALRAPMDEEDGEQLNRNPDGHSADRYIQAAIQAATEIFSEASSAMVERLGTNSWRRRQYLRRLQDRPNTATATAAQAEPGRLVSSRPATQNLSLLRRSPAVANSRQSSRPATWALSSDTGASTADTQVTSFIWGRPVGSDRNSTTTSVTASQQPSVLQHLSPPEPPVDLEKTEEFECPLCHFQLPLTVSPYRVTREQWFDHVYLDLKPYTCTFDDCSWGNVMFGTKKDWFQHELDFHRSHTVWSCGICRSDFDVQESFVAHLMDTHQHLGPENLSLVVDNCKRYSRDESSPQCHLCGLSCNGLADLENHVGEHLELFALAVIQDHDSRPSDGAYSESYIHEYLAELPSHGSDEEAPAAEAKTITAESVRLPTTDAVAISRAADASDASNLDDLDKEVRIQRGNQLNLNEKIQTFLDKQQEAVQAPAQPTFCNVPEKDKDFLGRDDDLAEIHNCLSTMGRICTVTGRGGIGKTAIAKEYLYRYSDEYSYIFWVEAENAGTLQEKYNMIAEVLDTGDKPLPDQSGRTFVARECLTRMERRWLLIFDNVATWADIARYVPKSLARSQGSVFVTTRSLSGLTGLPSWQHQLRVELAPWSLDHSREFLLTSISKSVKSDNLQAHEEYDLAERVVEVVERLPLAVNMIVGYIKVSRCTLADFLEMWEERASRRRPRKRRVAALEAGIDNTIDSLWDIGIGEVRANCRKLLDVLSFLDPENIPKSLLVGDHDEEYLDFLHVDETLRYKRMIDQLDRQKLISIKMDGGEPAYGIHRVLQKKIQFDLDDYSFADAFRKAFRLIRKRFPRANNQQVPVPSDMERCRKYMPHVYNFHLIFKERFQDHKITPMGGVQPVELSELFYDAGFYVWGGQATAYDGLPFLETADKILNEMDAETNARVRADINCMTGLLLLNMGYVERAHGAKRLREAWEIRQAVYIQESTLDNDVLSQNAANDYSICLMNVYNFAEAGRLLRGCFERYQLWGPESENPFEYSKFYGNYSIILLWHGKIDESIRSIQKSLVLTEKFGGRKSQYYRRLFFLGCVYLQAGDLQKALETHLEALNARIELQGKLHENTILSMYAVGAMYHYMKNLESAIECIKQCIKAAVSSRWSEEALGRARYHLALLYEERGGEGDLAAAAPLREESGKVLDKFRYYAPERIREANDDMMIFDDMQGTFTGRYTGRNLLRHLQERARRQQQEQQQ